MLLAIRRNVYHVRRVNTHHPNLRNVRRRLHHRQQVLSLARQHPALFYHLPLLPILLLLPFKYLRSSFLMTFDTKLLPHSIVVIVTWFIDGYFDCHHCSSCCLSIGNNWSHCFSHSSQEMYFLNFFLV